MAYSNEERLPKVSAMLAEGNGLIRAVYVEMRAMLEGELRLILAEHPYLRSIGWHQYTPTYNDGSPLRFGADLDTETLLVNDEYLSDNRDWPDFTPGVTHPEFTKIYALVEAASSVLLLVDEKDLLAMYGDNVIVKVSADGVEIAAYEE